MFYKNVTLFGLVVCSSLGAFAQTTKAPVKPAVPQGTYLERALTAAKKDLADVNALIVAERKKIDSYQMCTMNEYFARQRSAEWFVNHYSDFETLSHKIDTVIAEANTKIKGLGNEVISVIPVEKQGASTTEVKVSLGAMIEYFKVYNGRMKSCQKNMQSELQHQMEDPRRNDLNLAHSQVVAAMKTMTTNLNASLADTNTHYELAFGQAECGYQLELRVSLDFNGTKQDYKFSLLTVDSQAAKVALTDEAKWSALIAKNEMIAGYPIDAMKRLSIFLKEERGECKEIMLFSKEGAAGAIFDTYANLKITGKKWLIKGDMQLVNGDFVDCEDLNGIFENENHHVIEITDACNLKKATLSGAGWAGQGEKPAFWKDGAIDLDYSGSGHVLRFTPRDVDTLDYLNVVYENTTVFYRRK